MKKFYLLSSLFILLSSCSNDIRPDISEFLSTCSLEKAKEFTKTISLTYSSLLEKRTNQEELGETTISFVADLTNSDEYYSQVIETFSGQHHLFDQDSQMYVTYTTAETKSNESSDVFITTVYKEGYKDLNKPDEKSIYQNEIETPKSLIQSRIDKIFYSSNQIDGVSGGLYYADFFISIAKFDMYIDIQDDKLFYHLDNYPFKNDQEEGIVNEKIVMNSIGMLESLELINDNFTSSERNITLIDVSYNTKLDM